MQERKKRNQNLPFSFRGLSQASFPANANNFGDLSKLKVGSPFSDASLG